MIIILGSALAMAIAPQPAVTHSVALSHQGTPIRATYRADLAMEARQIGLSAGARPSTQRCLWTANVGVVRDVSRGDGAAISRRLDAEKQIRGSRPGACSVASAQIAKDVATEAETIRSFVMEAARQDEESLRAELDGLTRLAQN